MPKLWEWFPVRQRALGCDVEAVLGAASIHVSVISAAENASQDGTTPDPRRYVPHGRVGRINNLGPPAQGIRRTHSVSETC